MKIYVELFGRTKGGSRREKRRGKSQGVMFNVLTVHCIHTHIHSHLLIHPHSHTHTNTFTHTLTLTCSIKVPHTESLLPSRGRGALLQVLLLCENILGPTASTLFQIPSHSHYTGDKGKKKHRVINKL